MDFAQVFNKEMAAGPSIEKASAGMRGMKLSLVFSSLRSSCWDGKENRPSLHHFIQLMADEISPAIVFFRPRPLFCSAAYSGVFGLYG